MRHSYTIRPPELADVESLGSIHVRIWRETYPGLMDQRFLDELDPDRSAQRWRDMIARPDEIVRLIALAGEDFVGFIAIGPSRDADPPTPTELMALNVVSEHHGTGLADQLLTKALGDLPAYLWVLNGNERAQAFYRRHGFALDGVTKFDERFDATDLRMTRTGTL